MKSIKIDESQISRPYSPFGACNGTVIEEIKTAKLLVITFHNNLNVLPECSSACNLCQKEITKKNEGFLVNGKSEFDVGKEIDDLPFQIVSENPGEKSGCDAGYTLRAR